MSKDKSDKNVHELNLEEIKKIANDITADFEIPIIENINERMKQFEKDGKSFIYAGQFLDIACMCSLRLTQLIYKFARHALSQNKTDFDVDEITEIHIMNFREMMKCEFKKGNKNDRKHNH